MEGGALPTARSALLDRLATVSLKWEEKKAYAGGLTQHEPDKVLAGLALAITTLGRMVVRKAELANLLPEIWFFDPKSLEPLLDTVLRLARGARLVQWMHNPDGETIAFEHQTWQEYYAARLIASIDDPEWRGLARYVTAQRELTAPFDIVRPHLHDPFWRNVILMSSARLDESRATTFVDCLLHANSLWEQYLYRDAFLAAACLTEGSNLTASTISSVLSELEEAQQLGIRPLARRAGQVYVATLLVLGRSADLVRVARNVEVGWDVRQSAAESLEILGQSDQADEAWLALIEDRQLSPKVRHAVAERLSKMGRTVAAIRAWSALENDSSADRALHREARKALRRLKNE
jgi:hypothetical protein